MKNGRSKTENFCPYCGSNLERYYSISSAAELCGLSKEFFRKRVQNREIGYCKFGKSVRIPASEIEKCFTYFPAFDMDLDEILLVG
ncbi:excisionase family DNA-binding protein [bacterium]|nr:excisionase family DNA-binding protein [bacterium]MBU1063724.1 excisionase family DNA-binding protein [bacterium]MBU1873376.1 excisionase family DNA-binding protein [bacterium]